MISEPTPEVLAEDERTRDIYERIDGYPAALPVPLPAPGDLSSLAEVGLVITPTSTKIVQAAFALSGFDAFFRRLPETAEGLLRRHELRGSYLYAPTISGTIALADDPRAPAAIDRAATLVMAARSLHRDLWAGRLAPDEHQGQPLEMGQYPNLFGTSLVVDPTERNGARIFKTRRTDQITVLVARRIFVLEVPEGTALGPLRDALAGIVAVATRNRLPADEPPPGLLTAADHDTQRKLFPALARSEVNAASLASLRHSLLTLCLDLDDHPASDVEAATRAHAGNPANRWYHQSLQLVVFGNGRVAAVCNFATYLDGNVMMRGGAELQRRAATEPLPEATTRAGPALAPARELSWEIDPDLFWKPLLDVRAVQDPQRSSIEVTGVGRRFFAGHGLDPVGAFVVALQMATQRVSREPIRIKQILTMAKYRCTDLRTATVSTPAVMRFVEATEGGEPDLLPLLRAAVESQSVACREARRHVPLNELIALFLASESRLRRLHASFVLGAAMWLLGRLGLYRPLINQVVISHPTPYTEVPLSGRPGSRIPYMECFTVHYRVLDDAIRVLVSPSVAWVVPNGELLAEVAASLERLRGIASGS